MGASDRVEWQPVDVAIGLGDGFGTVVAWPAQAVEHAAEVVSSHTGSGGSASGEHGGRSTTDSCGSPEHLDDGKGSVEFEHLALLLSDRLRCRPRPARRTRRRPCRSR